MHNWLIHESANYKNMRVDNLEIISGNDIDVISNYNSVSVGISGFFTSTDFGTSEISLVPKTVLVKFH